MARGAKTGSEGVRARAQGRRESEGSPRGPDYAEEGEAEKACPRRRDREGGEKRWQGRQDGAGDGGMARGAKKMSEGPRRRGQGRGLSSPDGEGEGEEGWEARREGAGGGGTAGGAKRWVRGAERRARERGVRGGSEGPRQ